MRERRIGAIPPPKFERRSNSTRYMLDAPADYGHYYRYSYIAAMATDVDHILHVICSCDMGGVFVVCIPY